MAVLLATGLLLGLPARADEPWDPRKGPNPAIDYDTVDLSTLGALDLTWVPERRKEPIIRGMLAAGNWEPEPGKKQAPYCEALLADLKAWKDVEIVEPVIRANSYGDPAFAPWREKCPGFDPHKAQNAENDAEYFFGTHHFEVFEFPAISKEKMVLYYRGQATNYEIDRFGKSLTGMDYVNYYGNGEFHIIDINKCWISGHFITPTGSDFAYSDKWMGYNNKWESAVVKYGSVFSIVDANSTMGNSSATFEVYSVNQAINVFWNLPNCVYVSKSWRD